jgi:hypothetical protein
MATSGYRNMFTMGNQVASATFAPCYFLREMGPYAGHTIGA